MAPFKKFSNDIIEKKEFAELSKAVESLGDFFPGNYAAFCDTFDLDGDGIVDFDEFMAINDK